MFARWPTVLSGTAVQYIAMPTFAFLLATQRQLTEPLFIGVIMVGCAPGAMASNVLTLTADGNTGYSISLTTVATMVSPLMVPLALQITLGQTVSTAIILSAAIKLCWMVVLPVIVGHLLSRVLPTFEKGGRNHRFNHRKLGHSMDCRFRRRQNSRLTCQSRSATSHWSFTIEPVWISGWLREWQSHANTDWYETRAHPRS